MRRNRSLFVNLVLGVGVILFLSMGTLAYFSISYVKRNIMNNVMAEADRFSDTIKLGTHYAMMSNVRDDIMKIIDNIARRPDVKQLRIYHKDGQIKFSNKETEIDLRVDIHDYACVICHNLDTPSKSLALKERVRIFSSSEGKRLLGIVSPIYNEPGCSSASCHAHSADQTILGILDVVISLDQVDKEIFFLEKMYGLLTVVIFLITAVLIFQYLVRFVTRPVNSLIDGTQMIASGEFFHPLVVNREDEMGRLAEAISKMGEEIASQQYELVRTNSELLKANNELEELSKIDPLTGLFNRRYLAEVFAAEYERARRYDHNLSVLMLDVDHFKGVNDSYGHLCGDVVLREIAILLKKTVRSTDIVARYGGEEMVVLLLETDCRRATVIAEKLRQEVASCEIGCDDIYISITVSIGVATYPALEVTGIMELLEAADLAMYRAKRTGRNKVVYSSLEFM